MLAVKIGHQTSGSAPSTTLRTPNVLGEEKKNQRGFLQLFILAMITIWGGMKDMSYKK